MIAVHSNSTMCVLLFLLLLLNMVKNGNSMHVLHLQAYVYFSLPDADEGELYISRKI